MDLRGNCGSINVFHRLLEECIKKRDLTAGREVYCLMKRNGFESNTFLGGPLIRMFAVCGSLSEANQAFSKLPAPDASAWSAIIFANANLGHGKQAIELYYQTQQLKLEPVGHVFVGVLKACANVGVLEQGKLVHGDIIENGFGSDVFVGNTLINMYVKCSSLNDARRVFDSLPESSTVTWNAMMAGYTQDGHGQDALQLFSQMVNEGLLPDNFSYVSILKACSSIEYLDQGKLIHALIIKSGFESDVFIGSILIHMYARCGSLEEACRVFDDFPNRSVVTWNAVIAGYVQYEQSQVAFQIFEQMLQVGIKPNDITFVSILKMCSIVGALQQGKMIHCLICKRGFESNVMIATTLIDMYTKCGSLKDACGVFEKLPKRNVVTWSAMIAGYAHHGHGLEALLLFEQMKQKELVPNDVTFVSLLKSCSSVTALDQGKLIHGHIIKSNCELKEFVGSTLIDMYVKCGSLKDACWVFETFPQRNIGAWSAMVSGYAEHGYGQKALQLFWQMQQEGVQSNSITFLGVLKACSSIEALDQGKLVHAQICESCCELDVFVGNTLIDMYTKCVNVTEARKVFNKLSKQNVVTWNAMISGYAQLGQCQEVFQLFQQLQHNDIEPSNATFSSILKACCSVAAVDQVKLIHSYILNHDFDADVFMWNAIIDSYAKCGYLEDARRLLNKTSKQDLLPWNAIIAGYAQYGHGQEALEMFSRMQQEAMEPDDVTFVSILQACSAIAALDQGKLTHAFMIKSDCTLNLFIRNSLIDMYAKCGSLDDAQSVFETSFQRDVVSWSALVAGHAQHCNYEMALECYKGMQQAGWKPNHSTFASLLSACSHVGLVNEAFQHFKSMTEVHGIVPALDHYNIMVDILGRAGCLIEAEDILQTIPFQFNIVGWTSLLSHCRTHGNVDLGGHCFEQFVTIDCRHASGYMLVSNIYVDAGMWENVDEIQDLRKRATAGKKPGSAFIEGNGKVHSFIAGDTSHPSINDINAKVGNLNFQVKVEGYVPHLDSVLHPIMYDVMADVFCD